MTILYKQKVNKRTLGSELLILNEQHIVGITGVATLSPDQVRLIEVPLKEVPSTVAIPGVTEVETAPGTNEFQVDYENGRITFNAIKNGDTVFVTYKGRGSLVDAEDVNELQDPVGVALKLDGEITDGHVKPAAISTNPSDDFTFPNKVTVEGDLDVKGTTTSLQTEIVTIDDNILLLNSNVTGEPSENAGIEIERGSSPNVELVWNETNDSWQLKSTLGSPILEAFDVGNVTILNDLTVNATIIGSNIRTDTTLVFEIDRDANSSSEEFQWFTDDGIKLLMDLDEAGDLTVLGTVIAAGFSGPTITTSITSDTSITYGIDEDDNSTAELHLWRTNGSLELMRLSETGDLKVTGRIGINIDPIAEFHNAGSTVLGLTTDTDPASIIAATVDSFTGIAITTTGSISVTLPTPTNTTLGRFFTVLHVAASSGTLLIEGSNVGVGKGSTFMWDGASWIPVGATGGFELLTIDPVSPVKADVWFNDTDKQFKGYNGTNNVILG